MRNNKKHRNDHLTMIKSRPIHIAFCVNDGYALYIMVTIKGLLENNPGPIVIHVLSDCISARNVCRLKDLVRSYPFAELHVVIVDDSKLRRLKNTWTIYTWYRVLLPEILDKDVHRVLYLDADVLVAGDIRELFSLDMTGKAIAGTIDFQSKDISTYLRCGYEPEKGYVCAGVLLMNLDYWREHNIADRVVRWGKDNNDRIRFPDQDSINFICRDAKILLPLKYDIVDGFFHHDYYYESFPQELRECVESPVIIHYAGQAPWVVELSNHLLQDEWDKYNKELERPVRKRYQSKGLLKIKVMLSRAFYAKKSKTLNKQDVIDRLGR